MHFESVVWTETKNTGSSISVFQVISAPGDSRTPPALRMWYLGKLPLPTLWKKIQATRCSERSHGEVHEQVGCLTNQPVQRLAHGLNLPPDHVDPLDPDHIGHI